MDFLKSAIGSAIAKGGGLPFSLGDRVDIGDSVWALHNGTKRVRWLFGSFPHAGRASIADDDVLHIG